MKQYTTSDQTAKLIELGVEQPKSEVKAEQAGDYAWYNPAYSIGELLEILPRAIGDDYLDISSPFGEDDDWLITYGRQVYEDWEDTYTFINKELIDAIYDMILELKEKGVI